MLLYNITKHILYLHVKVAKYSIAAPLYLIFLLDFVLFCFVSFCTGFVMHCSTLQSRASFNTYI